MLIAATPVTAWDGFEWQSGTSVNVDKGEKVREGQTITYFDYDKAEYHMADVESMRETASGVEIEVYDYDSGEYRTFDME